MKRLLMLVGLVVMLVGCGNSDGQNLELTKPSEGDVVQNEGNSNEVEDNIKVDEPEEDATLTDEDVLSIIEETLATFDLGDGIKGVSDYYTNLNYDDEPYAIVILESIYEDMFFANEDMTQEKCQELYNSTVLVANDLFDTLIDKLRGYDGYFLVSVNELSKENGGNNEMNIGYVSNQDKKEGQKFVVSNTHMYSDWGIEIETIDGHY